MHAQRTSGIVNSNGFTEEVIAEMTLISKGTKEAPRLSCLKAQCGPRGRESRPQAETRGEEAKVRRASNGEYYLLGKTQPTNGTSDILRFTKA